MRGLSRPLHGPTSLARPDLHSVRLLSRGHDPRAADPAGNSRNHPLAIRPRMTDPWSRGLQDMPPTERRDAQVPYTSGPNATDLQEVTTRNHTARQVIGGFSRAFPTMAEAWQLIDSALADTPGLTADTTHRRTPLPPTRRHRTPPLAATPPPLRAARAHAT